MVSTRTDEPARIRWAGPKLPGLSWGQTTRAGGASTGAYASMNLATHVGDDPAAVERNWASFTTAAGWTPNSLARAEQVHGDAILCVTAGGVQATPADALISTTPGIGVGVFTADCVPVLLVHEASRTVAAVHCGWKGAQLALAGKTVRRVESLTGCAANGLRVWIGAAVRQGSYEVGPEFAERFAARHLRALPGGKYLFDVVGAVCEDLRSVGVAAERIGVHGLDTFANPGLLYSYRRDGVGTGRMLSFVGYRND